MKNVVCKRVLLIVQVTIRFDRVCQVVNVSVVPSAERFSSI